MNIQSSKTVLTYVTTGRNINCPIPSEVIYLEIMRILFAAAAVVALVHANGSWAAQADKGKPSAAAPSSKTAPGPHVQQLSLEPASITLKDGREARKVLVFGQTDAATRLDLTGLAVLKTDSPAIDIDPQGYIH